MTLFEHSEIAKREAIERVERNAEPDWIEKAVDVIACIARRQAYLTTDDVWPYLPGVPHERRAMGPVMTRAAKLGLIARTGEYRQSVRAVNHGRPVTVWESLL